MTDTQPEQTEQYGSGGYISKISLFIQLFSFVLLAFTATSLGVLIFQIINKYFPDSLQGYGYYASAFSTSTLHYALAAVIIASPLYFFAMRWWFKLFAGNAASESKANRFLSYLIIFVASSTIVGDFISLLFSFLEGEMTYRFVLKALTVMILAILIFGFYYIERRKIQYKKLVSKTLFSGIIGIGILLVLFSVIVGFIAGGSPFKERLAKMDLQKVNDLNQISLAINQYASYQAKLPQNLDDLRSNVAYSSYLYNIDPANFSGYEYRILSSTQYELCASFNLSAGDNLSATGPIYGNGSWDRHDAGRSCSKLYVILGNPSYPPLK